MKTICFRLLTLMAFAACLGFISDTGIRIEEGKVCLVGRCSLVDGNASATAQLLVGVAQAEFAVGFDGKPEFRVKRIFTRNPDESGFFMMRNLPKNFTYIFLGIQSGKDQPMQVKGMTAVNAAEKCSRVLNLGHHQVAIRNDQGCDNVMLQSGKSSTIEEYMRHFIARDNLTRLAHHICNRTGYWGKGNSVISLAPGSIRLLGLDSVVWQKL
jgi:hypothetical protein